ncbi:hypothetical protein AMTR_s00142p00088080 [Amborella trichopoda]|uniref:Uncharacterized protein n=1 Tax=Amborella trichopoda TaxID=13333 RepID=W1PED1_AMBTC|nr:hypothetical protein AMTR_s00142p00088080 [Amborella trichopoda]
MTTVYDLKQTLNSGLRQAKKEFMSSSGRNGHPKHANKYAWKPNAGHKKNETEVGGKLRPFSQITGVCGRCKDQIEWKRNQS